MTVGADPVQVALDKLQADFATDLAALKAAIAPPPPPLSVALFARHAYGAALAPTDPTHLAGGHIVVQADAAGIALAKQIEAAGAPVQVLAYCALDCVKSDQLDGATTAVPYFLANQNESWFLHRGGARVQKPGYPTNLFTNFGDPGWQMEAKVHVKQLLGLGPFAGVWFDNADTTEAFLGGGFDEIADDAALQTAVISALSTVVASVRSAGKLAFGNIPGNNLTVWQKYIAYLDGAEIESFTNGGRGIAQQISGGFFAKTLQQAVLAEQQGKTCELHTYDVTPAGFGFALAAMLLVAGGNCRLDVNVGSNNSTSNVWTADCDAALALGNPTGPFTLSGGVYRRPFDGGAVTLDTNTLAYSIG